MPLIKRSVSTMPIVSQPSFQTLDQLHFVETGEHLTPIAGDACPHPAEYYIKKTLKRQHRARTWELLNQQILAQGIVRVKPSSVNNINYSYAQRVGAQIYLYNDDQNQIMVLNQSGEEHVEPSPTPSRAVTPATPFVLRAPWIDNLTGLDEPSRVRPKFLKMLSLMPVDALLAEQEEWQEEVYRAEEHLAAVRAEMAKALQAPQSR